MPFHLLAGMMAALPTACAAVAGALQQLPQQPPDTEWPANTDLARAAAPLHYRVSIWAAAAVRLGIHVLTWRGRPERRLSGLFLQMLGKR
jgi:hypothetical protein